MIPCKPDYTCLVCTHAIGNHGSSMYDKLNQYYCQLCSCKFSFVPGAAYITVVNDPIDSIGDGTKVLIKDELKEGIVIPVTDFLCSICFHPQEHHYSREGKCLVPTCTFNCTGYVYMAPEDYKDWGVKSGPNLSPNAPLEPGGLQSLLNLRFDLLDTKAMFQLAGILDYGAKKYGENNWRKILVESHLNHALTHIFAYLQHDTQDDHLGHAFCRLMFALGTEKGNNDSNQ